MKGEPPRPLDNVAKIAVLVPHSIGDFMFTLPALHALKHGYPDAELVIIGKPWQADFLRGRPGPVDRVLLLPPVDGVGGFPDADSEPVERFVEQARAERFDIAVQLYGGGRFSNPFVARLGARLTAGTRADDAPALDRWVRYAQPNNRRLALLEVAEQAGAVARLADQELCVTDDDRREAAAVLPPGAGQPLVLLQPGSTDPRRCWPPERFAAVGDALAGAGARIAVNGTAAEASLVRTVIDAMRHPAIDLSGKLGLRGLCGLLERVAMLVSNDTGPLHMALAIGTPAVGIFWLTNLIDGTPLRQGLLRVALSVRVHCPACGAVNLRTRCPHNDSFVSDVPLEEVTGLAMSLLRT
ncbi:glycosyltransferase family 9 protein [Massilia horti]|uniref:Glycosyltransferase family 9 protein n=1 Tax=Massilia horti TaxID=2562153 RepID=A0A4Y9SXX2_9BURK|nr:glycosyltransferase family 9 protein [Massilia horti]TFW30209.1 glycosyltransferase family 9 protein [Massilia horti]